MKYNSTLFCTEVLFYYETEAPVVVLSKQQPAAEINIAHLRLEEKIKASTFSF